LKKRFSLRLCSFGLVLIGMMSGCHHDAPAAVPTKAPSANASQGGEQTIEFTNATSQRIPSQALDAESTSSTPANGPAGQQK
jgi:hypothetical protein